MSEELRLALIKLIEAAEGLLDELGYQGVGGKEVRDYYAARQKVLELAPELNGE